MHRTTISAIALVAAAWTAFPARAQQSPGPATLTTHPLKDGIYWVTGGVANTGFIVGDRGVVVFDAQRDTGAARELLAAIARVTAKPVDQIVVSHADPDHVGGLPAFPARADIIAQENATNVIRASIADAAHGGPLYGPLYRALADHLPTRTVAGTQPVVLDGVRMVLVHVAPAHTSADLVAYLPSRKLVFAGDLLVNNSRFPVVHVGGTSLGWIESMRAILALDADTYVPGHGAIEPKTALRARLRDAEQRREQVKALVAQKKSLAEVMQALPDTALDPRFPTYTQTVYEELTRGYPPAQAPWANLAHE